MASGGNGNIVFGLGGPAGFGEVAVPRGDDNSLALDASGIFRDGLRLFSQTYLASAIYVNTNGTISFGRPVQGYPGSVDDLPTALIAPFWGDVDTRLDGEGTESGAIWADIDSVSGVLTVTWGDVGVYRRNADVTNRFQVQLHDQGGGDFDVTIRYENIDWTIGTAEDDTGAVAGIFDPNPAQNVDFGGVDQLDLVAGNTGSIGLWAFEVRDGKVAGLTAQTNLITGSSGGDTLTGSSGSDTILALDGDDFIFGDLGQDVITGGFGADQIDGGGGADTLTGSAQADVIIGGDGDDFLNGGWGHDTLTGGDGADRFFHLGISDHGSDWVTDYSAAQGDVLMLGGEASASDFLVQYATTIDAGSSGVREAFVTYIPTGEILWALVDGESGRITIRLTTGDFDLA